MKHLNTTLFLALITLFSAPAFAQTSDATEAEHWSDREQNSQFSVFAGATFASEYQLDGSGDPEQGNIGIPLNIGLAFKVNPYIRFGGELNLHFGAVTDQGYGYDAESQANADVYGGGYHGLSFTADALVPMDLGPTKAELYLHLAIGGGISYDLELDYFGGGHRAALGAGFKIWAARNVAIGLEGGIMHYQTYGSGNVDTGYSNDEKFEGFAYVSPYAGITINFMGRDQ